MCRENSTTPILTSTTTSTCAFCVVHNCGAQLLAPPDVVDAVIKHIKDYRPPKTDLRVPVRSAEAVLLSEHAAALAGSQALDYKKQDPMTEIEESIEANEVMDTACQSKHRA